MASPPLRSSQRRWLALLAGVAVIVVGAALVVVPRLGTAPTGGGPAIGGPFALTDTQGHPVTDQTYRGKLMLVYFGYTFCPDVCPTTLGVVGQAFDQLTPRERAQVVPLFITVDPERDTVKQLADYVVNFSPSLIGLTGTPEQIATVEKEYHIYAKKAPGPDKDSYSMDHSSILYLMGRDGKFLSHFGGNAPASEMVATIRKFLS